MDARIIRYTDAEVVLGMHRATIRRRVKSDPTFPKPIRLGNFPGAAVGFLSTEIDAWIAHQASRERPSA